MNNNNFYANCTFLPRRFIQTKGYTIISIMFIKLKRLIIISLLVTATSCNQPYLIDTNGQKYNWDDFRGRWLVVNYWAQWCTSCLKEIPELNQLHLNYNSNKMNIIGINFDKPLIVELKRQITSFNIKFPVILNDFSGEVGHFKPAGLPVTYIFDPSGELKIKLIGAQTAASITKHINLQIKAYKE